MLHPDDSRLEQLNHPGCMKAQTGRRGKKHSLLQSITSSLISDSNSIIGDCWCCFCELIPFHIVRGGRPLQGSHCCRAMMMKGHDFKYPDSTHLISQDASLGCPCRKEFSSEQSLGRSRRRHVCTYRQIVLGWSTSHSLGKNGERGFSERCHD